MVEEGKRSRTGEGCDLEVFWAGAYGLEVMSIFGLELSIL